MRPRVGLVGYVEEQLERDISLGRLPPSGQFGSEQKLARSYGVSRTTVREALRRLAARGLVVQHPGRKTRAVALDESLTLENLGVALHDERSPEGRRLLEGYFSLKRQVLVELLVDCCTTASKAALEQLEGVCFTLGMAARWQEGERYAQLEFELLKLAARAADRPGHLLLIQSMQRAWQGIAARVLPLLDGETQQQWAFCAMHALGARDAQALGRDLPPLMRACDERVLDRLAPAAERKVAPEPLRTEEEHVLDRRTPALEGRAAFKPPHEEEVLPVESASEAPVCRALLGNNPSEPGDAFVGGEPPGEAFTNLSDCRTGSGTSPAEGGSQPEPPTAGSWAPPRVMVAGEEPLHGTRGHSPTALATSQPSPTREHRQPPALPSQVRSSTPSPEG